MYPSCADTAWHFTPQAYVLVLCSLVFALCKHHYLVLLAYAAALHKYAFNSHSLARLILVFIVNWDISEHRL